MLAPNTSLAIQLRSHTDSSDGGLVLVNGRRSGGRPRRIGAESTTWPAAHRAASFRCSSGHADRLRREVGIPGDSPARGPPWTCLQAHQAASGGSRRAGRRIERQAHKGAGSTRGIGPGLSCRDARPSPPLPTARRRGVCRPVPARHGVWAGAGSRLTHALLPPSWQRHGLRVGAPHPAQPMTTTTSAARAPWLPRGPAPVAPMVMRGALSGGIAPYEHTGP